MGLLDLKSDLSKYRKPAPKTELKKEAKTGDKNFGSKNPLADMAKNLQKPESCQQTDEIMPNSCCMPKSSRSNAQHIPNASLDHP